MNEPDTRTLRKIRVAISIFIVGLILSGVTSFALHTELNWLVSMRGPDANSGFDHWLRTVRDGLAVTHENYPWLAYGTDWLAFAHIVIALFFIGPLVDPVRNV